MNEQTKPTMDEFLSKIESLKEKAGVDITTTEDLSIAVMNLISLEEHFFFTGMKTGKDEYFDTTLEIREVRKGLLAQLMPENELLEISKKNRELIENYHNWDYFCKVVGNALFVDK